MLKFVRRFTWSLVLVGTLVVSPSSSFAGCKEWILRLQEHLIANKEPLPFTPEEIESLQQPFGDSSLTLDQQIQSYTDLFLNLRLSKVNTVSRFFARGPLKASRSKYSVYEWTLGPIVKRIFGSHYNPFFNRIANAPEIFGPFREWILVHEMEHAVHRNQNPFIFYAFLKAFTWDIFAVILRTPISPTLLTRIESRSIGMEWEWLRMMPKKIQFELQERLSSFNESDLSNAERLHWINIKPMLGLSLAWILSDLPKDEFIKKKLPVHHYDLPSGLHRHYSFGLWKAYLLAAAVGKFAFFHIYNGMPYWMAQLPHARELNLTIKLLIYLTQP